MNGLELALELIPIPSSEVGLEVRESNGRQEILGDSRTYPRVSTSTEGFARTNASRNGQGPGSGSPRRRTGRWLHPEKARVRSPEGTGQPIPPEPR